MRKKELTNYPNGTQLESAAFRFLTSPNFASSKVSGSSDLISKGCRCASFLFALGLTDIFLYEFRANSVVGKRIELGGLGKINSILAVPAFSKLDFKASQIINQNDLNFIPSHNCFWLHEKEGQSKLLLILPSFGCQEFTSNLKGILEVIGKIEVQPALSSDFSDNQLKTLEILKILFDDEREAVSLVRQDGSNQYVNKKWRETFPKQIINLASDLINLIKDSQEASLPRFKVKFQYSDSILSVREFVLDAGQEEKFYFIKEEASAINGSVLSDIKRHLGNLVYESQQPMAVLSRNNWELITANRIFKSLFREEGFMYQNFLVLDSIVVHYLEEGLSHYKEGTSNWFFEVICERDSYKFNVDYSLDSEYVYLFGNTVTREKELDAKLQIYQKQYNKLQDAAKIGFYEYDLRSGARVWTPLLEKCFPEASQVPNAMHFDFVHPQDKSKIKDVLELTLSGELDFYARYKVQLPGTGSVYLEDRNEIIWDDKGVPVRIVGYLFDISNKMELSRLKAQSKLEIQSFEEINDIASKFRKLLVDSNSENFYRKATKLMVTGRIFKSCSALEVSVKSDGQRKLSYLSGHQNVGAKVKEVPLKKSVYFLTEEQYKFIKSSNKLRSISEKTLGDTLFLKSFLFSDNDCKRYSFSFPLHKDMEVLFLFEVGKSVNIDGVISSVISSNIIALIEYFKGLYAGVKYDNEIRKYQIVERHLNIQTFSAPSSVKLAYEKLTQSGFKTPDNKKLMLLPSHKSEMRQAISDLVDGKSGVVKTELKYADEAKGASLLFIGERNQSTADEEIINGLLFDHSELKSLREDLSQVFKFARLAKVEIDIRNKKVKVNQPLADLFALSLKKFSESYPILEIFNPKIKSWIKFYDFLESLSENTGLSSIRGTFILRMANTVRYLRLHLDLVSRFEGLLFLQGFAMDISNITKKSTLLTEKAGLLGTVKDLGEVGFFTYYEKSGEFQLDESLRQLLGIPPNLDLTFNQFSEIFSAGFKSSFEELIIQILEERDSDEALVKMNYSFDSLKPLWVIIKGRMIQRGNQTVVVGAIRNVNLVKKLESHLQDITYRILKASWYQSRVVQNNLNQLIDHQKQLVEYDSDGRSSVEFMKNDLENLLTSVSYVKDILVSKGLLFSKLFRSSNRSEILSTSGYWERYIHIVDDDVLTQKLHRKILQSLFPDGSIEVHSDGLSLMELVEVHKESNHLILLDLNMPGMPGKEVLSSLMSAKFQSARMRVIIVSSELTNSTVNQVLAHPLVYHYIEKPLTLDKIRFLVD